MIQELATFGVSTVHEAIGRTGYLGPYIRPIQQDVTAAGTAVTVLCWPGDNLMVHAAVEHCKAGDIMVLTTSSPCTDGLFGELLATSLRAHGVTALVTTTGVRDIRALRDMRFPVWSAAVSAQGTVKQTPGAVNVPIAINGQLISPGDAIIADDDGVVRVPGADVPRALEAARQRIASEDETRRLLASGVLGLDVYGLREKLR